MSASLLCHEFGIQEYQHNRTEYRGGKVLFTIEHEREELVCSHYGSRKVIYHGIVKRRFRTVPIGQKPVFISLAVQRVFRKTCSLVRQVKL